MAANQGVVSFDQIIQAGKHGVFCASIARADLPQGRQRKEKEKLANDILGQGRREKQRLAEEIFGRGRSNNAPNHGSRKSGAGPSLASRVGIAKVCWTTRPLYAMVQGADMKQRHLSVHHPLQRRAQILRVPGAMIEHRASLDHPEGTLCYVRPKMISSLTLL